MRQNERQNYQQQFKLYRILMNRSSSKHKYQTNSYGITITLLIQTKTIILKVPMPCLASTLRDMLVQECTKINSKLAYFQTTNQDYLTDYKLQEGSGWIRNNCQIRCILRKKKEQILTGMDAYKVLKCIGVGGFSKVYLTRSREDGTFFAAKFIQKQKVSDKKELIQNQRYINENISFPFLVYMRQFIDTSEYYIMILEYCPGGELFNLQRKVIRFQEDQARKYFVQVLFAIQYLHQKGIIYRDLKPENIMFDVKGHLKITDFGLAKQTKEKRYSFCGSLEYMSPEILARSGHSFQVDFYCLGALLYEMLVGCPPYYEPESVQSDTKARILHLPVEFPQQIELSDSVKDLILKLLIKDPKKRLGHLGGAKQIKCHPWIGRLVRSQWLSRGIQMPYPVNLDDFNFDCRDITVSANRMLISINSQFNTKKRQISKTKSSYIRKSDNKLLSPYRNNRESLNYLKKNMSTQKLSKKPLNLQSISKSKKSNKSKSKDIANALKACYMSTSKLDLQKYLRYPTQIADNRTKLKGLQKQSILKKRQTEMKENEPYRQKNMKKRKTKQELIFMQIKRH